MFFARAARENPAFDGKHPVCRGFHGLPRGQNVHVNHGAIPGSVCAHTATRRLMGLIRTAEKSDGQETDLTAWGVNDFNVGRPIALGRPNRLSSCRVRVRGGVRTRLASRVARGPTRLVWDPAGRWGRTGVLSILQVQFLCPSCTPGLDHRGKAGQSTSARMRPPKPALSSACELGI